MPPIRAPSPAHSIDSTMAGGAGSDGGGDGGEPPAPPRAKHIEVCVRLRPLHIQGETSSASFFHPPRPQSQSQPGAPQSSSYANQRKPGIPRPTIHPNSNPTSHSQSTTSTTATTKLASKLPSFMRSTKGGRRSTTTPTTATTTDAPNTEPPPLFHGNANTTTMGTGTPRRAAVPDEPTAMIYAWDVVDRDTVAQSPRTELVPGRTHAYTLDAVHGAGVSTQQLYDASVRDLVRAALEGYHTAVLAYGQTSTGKTHTMTGTVQEPGIIPLAVKECFQCLQQWQQHSREYLLRVSYLEIYKEHIRDLLAPSTTNNAPPPPPVRLFEQRGGKLQIKGLREEVVTCPEQVFALLAKGEARRQVGATHLNQHSSRSHVMVRLWIESRSSSSAGGAGESVRASTLSLVDLAGSESVRLTGSTDRQAEGHYINQSLMTLGQVVYALSEDNNNNNNKRSNGHIPYRDSKLTRILQPSLSGNAQVLLLCCISPLPSHVEESHNTFKFATRAKKIPQKAVLQNVLGELDDKTLLQSYREEIETLRQQLREAETQRQWLLRQQRQQQERNGDGTDMPLLHLDDVVVVDEDGVTAQDAEEEMLELMDAIQKMERLILKTGVAQPSPPEATRTAPSSDSPVPPWNGDAASPEKPTTTTPNNKDDLQQELSRIQGLLGSVLKKKRSRPFASSPQAAASDEEVRQLRAQLEEHEVVTSLRQADSSFLQAQLEEKDELLLEVSKILEAVEERQSALEAENQSLRRQVERWKLAAARSRRLEV